MSQLIHLEDVSKTFKTKNNVNEVLSHINMEILSGQNISIIGPSGVGKSTLLNLIGLTTVPSAGSVIVSQKDTKKMNEKELAALRNQFFGYVTQDFGLIEDETVLENVEIPLLYNKNFVGGKRARIKQVQKVLEQVSISEKMYEKAKTLSGGQRQRVAIARALVNEPKLLLCDEPTGSLDAETGEEIFDLLNEVSAKTNKTLILVTHNLQLAARCPIQLQIQHKALLHT